MFVGICIGDDTDRISDGEIVVDTIALFDASGVSDHIAIVFILDNDVFPHPVGLLHRFAIANFTVELCHGDTP
jgi:hypothetical protein